MTTFNWQGGAFNRRVIRAANAGISAAAMSLAETARRSFGVNHGGVPSVPGRPPNTQTGNLRRRIAWVGPRVMGDLRAAYGTDVAYGRHLEFGAKPVAKRAKYLTVPITDRAVKLLRRFGSVRNIPGLVWSPSKKKAKKSSDRVASTRGRKRARFGGYLGFRSGGVFEPMFVLVKSVRILARPWLRPSVAAGRSQAVRAFQAAANRAARPT